MIYIFGLGSLMLRMHVKETAEQTNSLKETKYFALANLEAK